MVVMTATDIRGGTRDQILAILRRRASASVDDLSQQLGLSGPTVRRHLDVLLRDGLVGIAQLRGRTGRPRFVYSLTAAAAEQFGRHNVRLTHRLVDEIAALSAAETHGRGGADIASMIFDRMTDRLVQEYGPQVRGIDVPERARSAVALLGAEGLDFEVAEQDGDGVLLLCRNCPCWRFRGLSGAACEHDQRLLEELVGASVSPLPPGELPHDFLCGYRLRPRGAAG